MWRILIARRRSRVLAGGLLLFIAFQLWLHFNHNISQSSERVVVSSWKGNTTGIQSTIITQYKKNQVEGIKEIIKDDVKDKNQEKGQIIDLHKKPKRFQGMNLHDLDEYMQQKIFQDQNPPNCAAANRLWCVSECLGCGLGCQIHHFTSCLILAQRTQRVMIIKFDKWPYDTRFEGVFESPSESCKDYTATVDKSIWEKNLNVEELYEPKTNSNITDVVFILKDGYGITMLQRKRQKVDYPKYLPPAIPKQLVNYVTDTVQHPWMWWLGQMAKYLMRPGKQMKKETTKMQTELQFKHPIVGVHVRRTDKIINEGKAIAFSSYMDVVNNWFDKHHPNSTRRVFLATDDTDLLDQAHKEYPKHVFLHNPNAPATALLRQGTHLKSEIKGSPSERNNSLLFAALDMHFLSQCDYFVGTYSSNVGRLINILMQTTLGKRTSHLAVSLDIPYLFFGQQGNDRQVEALENYIPKNAEELQIRVGDKIQTQFSLPVHNKPIPPGYLFGRNIKTRKDGFFPALVVRQNIMTADFPGYNEDN